MGLSKLKNKFKNGTMKRLDKLGEKTQLEFIRLTIKGMNQNQLDQLSGLVMNYNSSYEKDEIIKMLKNEYDKRKIKWIE
jgi:hypothetical protein